MLSNRSSLPLCQVAMFSTSPMSTKCDRALLLCEHSLRASSPIWASEASLARTRERGAPFLCPSRLRRSLARSRETRFTRPNRRACSQASANMEFDRNCLQLSYALFFRLIHISLTFSERDVGTALSCPDKKHFEASISRKTYFKSSIWKYMATAPFSKTPRSCAVLFSWRHDGQVHRDKQTPKFTTVKFRSVQGRFFCFVFTETAGRHNW